MNDILKMLDIATRRIALLTSLLMMMMIQLNAQQVVRVGAFNFYPGIFRDTDGVIKGFYVDALNEIGKKENIKFEYVYGTWAEGLQRLKSGQVDILTSVAFTPERATFINYATTPLLTVWGEVYVSSGSQINGILDLAGKSVAIMKDDVNGQHLKELTKKLSINCNYTEVIDFEQVFSLVKTNQVDAGVVNNTFGAPKSVEYGLRSTGIVFNPFDIFFAVKNGENSVLLQTLNNYMDAWIYDRNSVYNISRQKWTHEKIGSIFFIPHWLKLSGFIISAIALLLLVFVVLLKYKVNIAASKIREKEAMFKTFMENTPGFVYIKDSNLNHIYRNKMVNSVLGNSIPDIVTSAKAIFESEIAEMLETMDSKILSGELPKTDMQYQCKIGGKKMWLHDYKFLLTTEDKKPVVGGISFDITPLKETELELIKAKEKAEESDRLKSAFLANISHEIRTPLNGILGFSELLADAFYTDEQKKEFVNVILSNGDNLLNIIDDIVDMSRIESGEFEMQSFKIPIFNFVKEIIPHFESIVKGKNLEFKFSCNCSQSPNNDVDVYADKHRLFQVFSHLISNAVKFTSKGYIEIGCSLKETIMEFYVRDSGIGIAPENQQTIFKRFNQVEDLYSRAYGGNGLGLTISKKVIEMMKGQIWVESELGKGSTFYFTIPVNEQG